MSNDQIRDLLVRGIIRGSTDACPIRFVQASIFDGELQDDIEHFEPFGFTGRPIAGAEVLLCHLDGDRSHPIAIVSTDRRYRIKELKPGEVCVFDSKGRKVFLKESGIEVEGVSSPIKVHTSATVTIDAPTVKLTGNLEVAGNVTAVGEVTGKGIVLSTHTHGGVERGGSSTGGPQ